MTVGVIPDDAIAGILGAVIVLCGFIGREAIRLRDRVARLEEHARLQDEKRA